MSEQPGHTDNDVGEFSSRLSLHQELGRKSFHVVGVVLPIGYVVLGPAVMRPFLLGLTAFVLLADVLRLRWGFARRVYRAAFARWSRGAEEHGLTGASMFVLAQTVAALIFPPCIAAVAMVFGVLGDPAAGLVGKRYGQYHWRPGKSLRGSVACLLVSFIGGTVCAGVHGSLAHLGVRAPEPLGWWVILPGAVAATLAEGMSGRISDNLTVPLAGGLVMWGMLAVGG